MMPDQITDDNEFWWPYKGSDDTIIYRPRLFGLCPLRRWVRLYSYNAYNL